MFGLAHKDVSPMKISKRVNPSWPTHTNRGPMPQGAVGHPYYNFFGSIRHYTIHIRQKSIVSDVSPNDMCTTCLNIAIGA
jgi:hypothetical protein